MGMPRYPRNRIDLRRWLRGPAPASVVTIEEPHRTIRLNWTVLAHAPILEPGVVVKVTFDAVGDPEAVSLC